jgi:RNA polymerase sigma factor (sigma-70 family)
VPTLEDIYDEHVWRVYAFIAYRVGSREDAEDLTQATFERAARAFARYDERKGTPITWLLAISRNLLVDHFRRRSTDRAQTTDPGSLEEIAPAVSGGEERALGLDPHLAHALAMLNDREREIVALRYGADLSGPEIAELKDLSLPNVQQILSRSLRRMRAAMEEQRTLEDLSAERTPE